VAQAGSAKAAGLGTRPLRENENWHTLADPAGHPFDLCLFPAKQQATLMGVMLDCRAVDAVKNPAEAIDGWAGEQVSHEPSRIGPLSSEDQ
jgi:hypothetical protein